MGAVCRRGLARGLLSRPFSPAAVERAASDAAPATVLADVDAEGYLTAAGGGAARLAAGALLAPHVQAASVLVTAAGSTLRLRLLRAAAPLHELLLWFDEPLLAALHMPFLSLHNIRGRKEYECGECGARFEEPNPLKTHLFLRCAPVTPHRFWSAVAARLTTVAAVPAGHTSAFRRVAAAETAAAPADEWAARLEAAAAEWGRARGGHACLYCGKLYSRKYGLKIHLRTHTGYRPLRCRHCARAFGDPSNLNKHVRLHAATAAGGATARPHSCARCGKALARRRDLERHMRARCAPPALAPAPAP